jgi:hypothetical protein
MRNPFEILMVGAYGLYSLAAIVAFGSVASNTLRQFGYGGSLVLLIASVVGAIVTLIGVSSGDKAQGVLLERAGLYSIAGPTGVYAVISVVNGGVRSSGFFLLLMALALASAFRIRQLQRAERLAKLK